jgi:hypothetical protein
MTVRVFPLLTAVQSLREPFSDTLLEVTRPDFLILVG